MLHQAAMKCLVQRITVEIFAYKYELTNAFLTLGPWLVWSSVELHVNGVKDKFRWGITDR